MSDARGRYPTAAWAGRCFTDENLNSTVALRRSCPSDQDKYALAKFVHTYTSWFCAALIAGHVGMALKHHFIDRDEVLSGMLPGRKS